MNPKQLQIISRLKFNKKPISLSDKGQLFFDQIKKTYKNGGIELFKIEIINSDRNLFLFGENPSGVIRKILMRKKLSQIMQTVTSGEPPKLKISELKRINSFGVFGSLSAMLIGGGAYSGKSQFLAPEVIDITKDFMIDFLAPDFSEFQCYETTSPWTNWFYDIAWDYSAFMFSKDFKELNIICITDTD